MSKKMLKRSLALGALMAFVITGQAWAKVSITLGQNEVVERDRIWSSFEITGEEGSVLNVVSTQGAAVGTSGSITGLDTLEITSASGWSTIELYGDTKIEADTIILNKKGEDGSAMSLS